ncbi:hypothetical protein K5549_008260 [Capra hircus]|nr:hypothetical protein K5549_008260 [Capra hircus]
MGELRAAWVPRVPELADGRWPQGTRAQIMDDWPGYDLSLFTYPQHYYGDLEYVLIPHGIIVDRIERLAKDIMKDIGYCDIMVLCVLKGGYKFCADLVEHLKNISRNSDRCVSMKVDFIRLKSYRNEQCYKSKELIILQDTTTCHSNNVLAIKLSGYFLAPSLTNKCEEKEY